MISSVVGPLQCRKCPTPGSRRRSRPLGNSSAILMPRRSRCIHPGRRGGRGRERGLARRQSTLKLCMLAGVCSRPKRTSVVVKRGAGDPGRRKCRANGLHVVWRWSPSWRPVAPKDARLARDRHRRVLPPPICSERKKYTRNAAVVRVTLRRPREARGHRERPMSQCDRTFRGRAQPRRRLRAHPSGDPAGLRGRHRAI